MIFEDLIPKNMHDISNKLYSLKLINDSDNDEDTDSIREIAKGCYKNCGFWEIDYE